MPLAGTISPGFQCFASFMPGAYPRAPATLGVGQQTHERAGVGHRRAAVVVVEVGEDLGFEAPGQVIVVHPPDSSGDRRVHVDSQILGLAVHRWRCAVRPVGSLPGCCDEP
ncbi:hypothetical protein ACFWBC_01305 [Streptomyces sp. NPDC059985]|uniref:hypothetical protein n=1 Tax=Streptomyces sp. NPDC059985 TaxID=3347025 RepID=UPI0036AB0D30